MREARMDIEDSEMGYLGYHGSESYGLTWKVSLVICLLYTSPSPRDKRQSRMPSSA